MFDVYKIDPKLDEMVYDDAAYEVLIKAKSLSEILYSKCFDDTADSNLLVPSETLFNALWLLDDVLQALVDIHQAARNEKLDFNKNDSEYDDDENERDKAEETNGSNQNMDSNN